MQLTEVAPTLTPPITTTTTSARFGEYVENGSYFLAFNTRAGRPFADLDVRNALAAAINLPALVQAATGGVGRPIAHGAAPGSWADFVPPPTSTVDLVRARALLDNAGWRTVAGNSVRQRDGKPLTATLTVRGDDQRRVSGRPPDCQRCQRNRH